MSSCFSLFFFCRTGSVCLKYCRCPLGKPGVLHVTPNCLSILFITASTNLCSVHFLVQRTWVTAPWRNRRPWRCCPDPEHIFPANRRDRKTKQNSSLLITRKDQTDCVLSYTTNSLSSFMLLLLLLLCRQSILRAAVLWTSLTDSPGSGFSCSLAAAALASCSSLLRVWMAVSAESISMGPQASWACVSTVAQVSKVFKHFSWKKNERLYNFWKS